MTSAKNGIQSIEIDGKTYNSYEDLKRAFAEAVDKDKATLNNGSVKFDNTVALKEKVFKKLLQQTDSFKTSIFNNSSSHLLSRWEFCNQEDAIFPTDSSILGW